LTILYHLHATLCTPFLQDYNLMSMSALCLSHCALDAQNISPLFPAQLSATHLQHHQ